MIYKAVGEWQYAKYSYSYLYIGSGMLQLIGCLCLYPCFYPLFDGVTTFAYLFIISTFILAIVNLIDIIVGSCKSNEYYYGISLFLAIVLLVGGIIYSPLVGHQKDRQKIFLLGQAGFLILEIYKLWCFYRRNGKFGISHIFRNKYLLTTILGLLTWSIQLLGTLIFIYGVYVQWLVIIGTFFYSMSSIFWVLRVWIYINNPNLKQERPCNRKNQQPESSSLSEMSATN